MSRNHSRPAAVGDQARSRAIKRQCPKCGRKGALRYASLPDCFGAYCRYEDCTFEQMTPRDAS